MPASSIPGYVQGHRFSDAAEFYNSGTEQFIDLTGGARFGKNVRKTIGTPIFASRGINNRRALFLDNTCHWEFPHFCPWEGSGLVVVEMNYVQSGTTSFASHIFGESGTLTSNSLLLGQFTSGQNRYIIGRLGQQDQIALMPQNQIAVLAWSKSQEDRQARFTRDGVTVTATTALAPANNGNTIGMFGQARCRLGNLNGTAGNTTASTTGNLHIFEQHFWKGDILSDNLPALEAFINELLTFYNVEDVGDTVPVITGVPTISGTAVVGETLTASPASVAGTPTPTRTWQWYRDAAAISGAAAGSYVLVTADAETDITVEQIETNTEGSDTALSAATTIAALGVPVLSAATATVLNTTSARLNVTTTVGDGNLYAVVTSSATQPSSAQIIAGQDHTGTLLPLEQRPNQGISAPGIQEIFGNTTGLTPGATYYGYLVQTAPGGTSNIVATGAFVPADVTAPTLTSLDAFKNGTNAWTGTVNTDTAEGSLYVTITTSSTTPTAAQIKAGQNHLGASSTAGRINAQAVTTTGPQALAQSGLADGVTYWPHATQTDVAGNDATPITGASFTTDVAGLIVSALQSGTNDMSVTGAGLAVRATSQPDPDGGNNAVEMGFVGNAGALTHQRNCTFVNGINVLRINIKLTNVGGSISLPVTYRITVGNMSFATGPFIMEYNLTAGTVTTGGSSAGITDLGGGWYELRATFDATGGTDLVGLVSAFMMESNTVADDIRYLVHDLTVRTS